MADTIDINKLNTHLCEALGLDPSRVQRVVIVASPETFPRAYVTMFAAPLPQVPTELWREKRHDLPTVIKKYKLVPQ